MREFAYAVVTIYCGELKDLILYKEYSTSL